MYFPTGIKWTDGLWSGAMAEIRVAELFTSIQGESTFAGWGCFFVRLAGCNLRCGYCDTPAAREAAGDPVSVAWIVAAAAESAVPLVEVTGGEPLCQPACRDLINALLALPNKRVLVETNGSLDISRIPAKAVAIVDIKCPGSGAGDSFNYDNLARLRPWDELKFVLSDRADYEWARDFVREHGLSSRGRAVHFGPVDGALSPSELGGWILADGLPVRLQLQLHKVMGLK